MPFSEATSAELRAVFFRTAGGRPVLWQSLLDMRKRIKGPPLGGKVSIVVTDIEVGISYHAC